jgi:O-antigen ligase
LISAAIVVVLLAWAATTVWMEDRRATVLACEAVAMALAAVWAAVWAAKPFPLRGHPALWFFAVPPVIGLLQLAAPSSIGTVNRWETWNAVPEWTADLTVCLLCAQVFRRTRVREWFLRAVAGFGVVTALASVIGYLASPEQIFGLFDADRPGIYLGAFYNKDHYAALMELILPITLYFGLTQVRDRMSGLALTWLLASGVVYASVIAGASRAGSILVTIEPLLVAVLVFKRKLAPTGFGVRAIGILSLSLIAFAAAAGWNTLWERLQMKDPYEGRREMLEASVAMMKTRPWLGFGLGTYESAYPHFALFDDGSIVAHAHNDWAEWAVEGGIPMSLFLLVGAVLSAKAVLRSIWGVGVLSVLTHSLIDFPMHRHALAFWTFALLGAVFSQAET